MIGLPSLPFLSGILSFTTGTTRSRRRSLCTPTQSPTSPACDQRRLLSHISNDPGSHTPSPRHTAVWMEMRRSLHQLPEQMLQMHPSSRNQSPDGTLGIQARNVTLQGVASGFKVRPKLILWSLKVAGTQWAVTKPVLCLSFMLVLPSHRAWAVTAEPNQNQNATVTPSAGPLVAICEVQLVLWRTGSFGGMRRRIWDVINDWESWTSIMLPKLFDITYRGPISDYYMMLPVVFQCKVKKIDNRF